MRVLLVPLCLAVSGCAIEPYQRSNGPDSSDQIVRKTISGVISETKLTGKPEVSKIRAANLTSPGDYVVCLRSSDPQQKLRYAVYFTGTTFVRSQMASQVDRCDEETYSAFVPDPAPVVAAQPLSIAEASAQKKK